MRIKRLISAAFAVAGSAIAFIAWAEPAPQAESVYVADLSNTPAIVRDGDTFRISGIDFRINGFDAPELKQTYRLPDGTILYAGEETQRALSTILSTGQLECVKTGVSYKRVVARCTVDGRDIAVLLIRQGLGFLDDRYTSGWYEKLLRFYEFEARVAGRGVWMVEDPQRPWDYRR